MAQIVVMQQQLPTAVPQFEFRVHEGCCFRSPRALVVYQANGATVTDKTKLVTKDQLLTWGTVGKAISKSGDLDTVPSHPAIPQAQANAPFFHG